MAHVIRVVLVVLLVHISAKVTCGDSNWKLSVTISPSGPVLEGSDVTLTCLIESDQLDGWIQWRLRRSDEVDYTDLNEPTYIYIADWHNLTFSGVFRNQTGQYQCVGRSSWMPSYWWNPTTFSGLKTLQVLYPSEITNKDRTWIGANDNYTATLECLITGNPVPNVTWYGPNDTLITSDTIPDRMSLEDTITGNGEDGFEVVSHVVFDSVDVSTDYGTYRCRAANSISPYDEHEMQLNETGKPDPPRNFRVYSVLEREMSVTWELGYDGGENLQAHYVNIRKLPWNFDAGGWVERWPPNLIKGYFYYLEQDTLYQMAVYALNKHGASSYATVDQRTKPDRPDDLGIRVTYNAAYGKITVTGMPWDNNIGTCLRLVGFDDSLGEWVSLRPDLDCIQRDGEIEYSGPNSGHIHCRYCHDDLCSLESHVMEVYPTTTRPPLPSQPKPNESSFNVTMVVLSVAGGTVVLGLLIALLFHAMKGRNCLDKISDLDELTRSGSPRPRAELTAHRPRHDEPPTPDVLPPPSYNEALEMDIRAGSHDIPPPAYEFVASVSREPTDHREYLV